MPRPSATGGPAMAVAYENHPRFHPVPTQEVFAPRRDFAPVPTPVPDGAIQSDPPVPPDLTPPKPPKNLSENPFRASIPPRENSGSQIGSKPEEVAPPPGRPAEDSGSQVPRLLQPNRPLTGWIFSPTPPAGKPEQSVIIKSDPASTGQQTRR